jgi:hypothetical protein
MKTASERAEQWLHKVYTEIEERFIGRAEESRRSLAARRG